MALIETMRLLFRNFMKDALALLRALYYPSLCVFKVSHDDSHFVKRTDLL